MKTQNTKKIEVKVWVLKLKEYPLEWGNLEIFQTKSEALLIKKNHYINIWKEIEIIPAILTPNLNK